LQAILLEFSSFTTIGDLTDNLFIFHDTMYYRQSTPIKAYLDFYYNRKEQNSGGLY